jgi:hypothetical protein
MSTKENLSDKLNVMLGTDVDWSKMPKEELEKLVQHFEDPVVLIQIGIKNLKSKAKEDILGRRLGDILDSSTILEKKGGPLGFGILPAIFQRSHGTTSTKTETLGQDHKAEKQG